MSTLNFHLISKYVDIEFPSQQQICRHWISISKANMSTLNFHLNSKYVDTEFPSQNQICRHWISISKANMSTLNFHLISKYVDIEFPCSHIICRYRISISTANMSTRNFHLNIKYVNTEFPRQHRICQYFYIHSRFLYCSCWNRTIWWTLKFCLDSKQNIWLLLHIIQDASYGYINICSLSIGQILFIQIHYPYIVTQFLLVKF